MATSYRLRGLLLGAEGERATEVFVDGGVFVDAPSGDVETLVDGGVLVPGLVDAHCHVGLGPDGPVPPAETGTR